MCIIIIIILFLPLIFKYPYEVFIKIPMSILGAFIIVPLQLMLAPLVGSKVKIDEEFKPYIFGIYTVLGLIFIIIFIYLFFKDGCPFKTLLNLWPVIFVAFFVYKSIKDHIE